MHALIVDGVVEKYPYTLGNLRKDNPNTSFPKNPSAETLEAWNVFAVARVDRPEADPITQNVTEETPVLVKGAWTQVWAVLDASPEEVAERTEQQIAVIKNQRASAYQQEADPLFFKYQRGEGSEEEWLDKIEEIRERYPYPGE